MQEFVNTQARSYALVSTPNLRPGFESLKIEEAFQAGGMKCMEEVIRIIEDSYNVFEVVELKDEILGNLHLAHMEKNNELFQRGLAARKIEDVRHYTDRYYEQRALENPLMLH